MYIDLDIVESPLKFAHIVKTSYFVSKNSICGRTYRAYYNIRVIKTNDRLII